MRLRTEGVDVVELLCERLLTSIYLADQSRQVPDGEREKHNSEAHSNNGDNPFNVGIGADVTVADGGQSGEGPVDGSQV